MQIDTAYIRSLTDMGDFLKYLVSLYGEELYKDKQHLCNLIADLYKGEERQKKLFRRAILEDNMARRVYDLAQKSLSERKALADAIAYRFAENNYLPKEIGEKVTSDLIKGLKLLVEITWKKRNDGNWEDNQGCVYNNDKTILLSGAYLKEIVVADGTIEIGDRAFFMHDSLEEITIPNSVHRIRNGAFNGCKSLEEITIPNGVYTIGLFAFGGTNLNRIKVSPDNNYFTSEDNVLYKKDKKILIYCTNRTSLEIPESVTEIRMDAFRGCPDFNKIKVSPDNNCYTSENDVLYTKDKKILIYCTNRTSLEIPENVTEIKIRAFINCALLETITIPKSVTKIVDGGLAFRNCTALNRIKVSPDNNYLTSEDNVLYTKDKNKLIHCTNRIYFDIPNSVTNIDNGAFYGCTSLKAITIPNSVTNIGLKAFKNCTSLEAITIPESMTYIGSGAFLHCTSLSAIKIQNCVRNIGDKAFEGCTALKTVIASRATFNKFREIFPPNVQWQELNP